MNGYVKLHRQFLEWEWHSDAKTVSVFLHLLLLARFEDGKWHGRQIKTGQVVTSYKSIAEETGISIQSARTVFNRLKSTGEITVETTNKFSLVTITKWELYQSQEDEPTGKPTRKSTTKQQSTNKQSAFNQQQRKNVKKERREETTTTKANPDSCRSFLSEEEMDDLAAGIHDVLDAAKRAGFPDTQADWDKCNELVADYGAAAVLTAIGTCADYPMERRHWRYLRGILAKDATGGQAKKRNDGLTDMQRKRKAFEERRTALRLAGRAADAANLTMSDMEVIS